MPQKLVENVCRITIQVIPEYEIVFSLIKLGWSQTLRESSEGGWNRCDMIDLR